MPEVSCGILLHRRSKRGLEVFLVHPGGPFWVKKDAGAWSIPKGLMETGEEPLTAARREFQEETGLVAAGPLLDLGEVRLKSGKRVRAWGAASAVGTLELRSSTFSLEWPPKSGRLQKFPEIDRAEFFQIDEARAKINAAQAPFLNRLLASIAN